MKTFNTMMTLAALCAITLTSNSYAQDGRIFRRHDGIGQEGPRMMHRIEERGPSLERLDSDGDARISESEFIDGRLERVGDMFEHLDNDGDGLISLEDRNFGLRFKERAGGEDMQACLQESGVTPAQPLDLANADSDGDNHLSFNEMNVAFEAQAMAAFAELDGNTDSYIDEAELTARHEVREAQRGELKDCLRSSRV